MQKNNGVWAAAALSLSEVTRRPQLDAPKKTSTKVKEKKEKPFHHEIHSHVGLHTTSAGGTQAPVTMKRRVRW